MIQGYFQRIVSAETIGSFRDHLCLVVKTFHAAESDFAFCSKPVEQEGAVSPQHFSDLLHRFELGSHGSRAPGIKKLACPSRGTVAPESLKILLEQVGSDGSEVTREQIPQFIYLVVGKVFGSFQQAPATSCQDGFFSTVFQFFGFTCPDRVNSLTHVTHDMKPVENINGTRSLFGNDRQIGFPHIAANKSQVLTPLLPKPVEEPAERFGGAVGADPKQAPFSLVKLIHQGDELILAFPPADFVGSDCRDSVEITMFKSPGDRHFHRTEDTVPTGFEYFSHFLPTQPFTPSGQEPGIGYREVTFAHCPRQLFDFHATTWALHTPWSVEEENRYAPQGNKGKIPDTQSIIARLSLAALGTDGLATGLRPQRYHQGRLVGIAPFAGIVDKTRLFFDTVQDSLYVHPVWPTLRSFLEETFPGKVRQDVFFENPVPEQYWQ